jgi:phage terminase large subunit-like protein
MPQRARKTDAAKNGSDSISRTKRRLASAFVPADVNAPVEEVDGAALLAALPTEVREALLTNDALLEELDQTVSQRLAVNQLAIFDPYPKQEAFFAAGATYRERLLAAGNQCGKTVAGAFEVSVHATGRYPDWWTGKRYLKPPKIWVCGPTFKSIRESVQEKLLGAIGAHGTGMIPKDAIESTSANRAQSDGVDMIKVKHASGGISTITFLAYEIGREAFQGASVQFVHCDEEPPADVYSEILTRTNATGGLVILTFTPLKGRSNVVKKFLPTPDTPHRYSITMTLDDVAHFTEEKKAQIIASYEEYERDARTRGIPLLGSGAVFPVAMGDLIVKPFTIPPHWRQIGGLDLGWTHPAAVRVAWDQDADVVYVTNAIKLPRTTPAQQALTLKSWGEWLPWAWPHDGHTNDRGSGEAYAELYRKAGLRMLPEHSTHESGGYSVEPGIAEMLARMQTGRFKVFEHLSDWFTEFQNYHRDNGKIAKREDHMLDATRQCVMALRFSRSVNQSTKKTGKQRVIRGAVVGNVYV